MGRWANNRVENSHLPFRRRERAMSRFSRMKTLQKFASVHASMQNGIVRLTSVWLNLAPGTQMAVSSPLTSAGTTPARIRNKEGI